MRKIGILMMMMIASFSGMAQGGGQQRSFDPAEMAKRQTAEIKEKCGLDEAQEKKVYDLMLANGKKMQQEMSAGGPPSEEMRTKMQKMRDEQNAEIKKILTAEQYKKFEKLMKEREAKMQQGGGGPK